MSTARTIFISAAETSGDHHAARLIKALKQANPQHKCRGLGGPAMAEAGCGLMENLVDRSAMLHHAVGQVAFYWKLLKRVKAELIAHKVDLVVLVDSPAWNLHVARAAKQLGIATLYYIVPQLWAWAPWRIGKVRRRVDHLACILPFEEHWFTSRGVPTTFVGHPLFDEPATPAPRRESHTPPCIALLPGSRKQEIERLWEPMQHAARRIKITYPDARFITCASSDANFKRLADTADATLNITLTRDALVDVVDQADVAIVASGTATLEVAGRHCPLIVMYYVNPWAWNLVGRWLLQTPYLSLVNILARRELVPEFMPFHGDIAPVVDAAMDLLGHPEKCAQMRQDLKELIEPLAVPGTSRRLAGIVQAMLDGTEIPASSRITVGGGSI